MKSRIHDLGDFADFLRESRKAQGLTQKEASALSGVSARLWSECENGKRPQVGFETTLRMLHTIGVDLSLETRARQILEPERIDV